jgi:hypothetical protein
MILLNQAVGLRSQTEISLHAVTANRIVLAGPPVHVFRAQVAASSIGLLHCSLQQAGSSLLSMKPLLDS